MSYRHFFSLFCTLIIAPTSLGQVIYRSPTPSFQNPPLPPGGVIYGEPIPGSERIIGTERVIAQWSTTPTAPTTVTTPAIRTAPVTNSRSPINQGRIVSNAAGSGNRVSGNQVSGNRVSGNRRSTNPDFNRSTARNPNLSFVDAAPTRLAIASSTRQSSTRSSTSDSSTIQQASTRIDTRWQDPLDEARRAEYDFRSIAARVDPAISPLASENVDFVRRWIDAYQSLDGLTQKVAEAEQRVQTTTLDLEDADTKLKQYGLTPTIGLLLRHKKEQLTRWRASGVATTYSNQVLADIREKQLALELITVDGSRPFEQAADQLAAIGIAQTDRAWEPLRNQTADLLRRRYRWIRDLRSIYSEYHTQVGRLESAKQALAEIGTDYRRLIDRHIVWIRSGETIALSDFEKLDDAAEALFGSGRSDAIGATIGRKWQSNRGKMIAMLLWITLIAIARWRCRSWLLKIGDKKMLIRQSKAVRLAVAGVLTVAVSAAIPAMLYLISRWLGQGIVSASTLHASSGAAAAALVALAVELPRQSLRNNGLFDRHVDIELDGRSRAATYLSVVGFGFVLAAYIVTLSGLTDRGAWQDSFSRFGFIASMLLLAWTAHRSLRPVGGFAVPLVAKFGGSVIHRIRFVLYVIGVGMPLGLTVLSSIGYGYSANEILMRATISWIAVIGSAFLWPAIATSSSYAWRWLTGTMPPPKQFDQYGEVNPGRGQEGAVVGHLASHFLELKHQLAFMCQCGLVAAAVVAAGWLWWDVVPMAEVGNPVLWTVMDDVQLAPTGLVDVNAAAADGAAGLRDARDLRAAESDAGRWVAQTREITALHLALAIGVLFVAFQFAKLVPSLYDALVLQRVSFDEAMEHFTFVLCRFVLFGVGFLIACHLVGLRWQTVQWLAVGLMVGLGFGLQDVIRNLMGGLVVLFEKPAKLGDRISIGKWTGRVAVQKLRTTTLSDDEGREVIVPNQNFMSDEVINHRGAGRVQAVTIEVAVHRDERSADVCRSLTEWMIEQKQVLLSPAPQATLLFVGQKSQRIEVRVWINEELNATRFRESMLTVAQGKLRDAGLLASKQPKQTAGTKTESGDDEDWMRAA